MTSFSVLVKFESEEDGEVYFADLGRDAEGPPLLGTKVSASKSLQGLVAGLEHKIVTVHRVSSNSLSP
jgi:hypothetical protein